jgi:hypothetical protein
MTVAKRTSDRKYKNINLIVLWIDAGVLSLSVLVKVNNCLIRLKR